MTYRCAKCPAWPSPIGVSLEPQSAVFGGFDWTDHLCLPINTESNDPTRIGTGHAIRVPVVGRAQNVGPAETWKCGQDRPCDLSGAESRASGSDRREQGGTKLAHGHGC